MSLEKLQEVIKRDKSAAGDYNMPIKAAKTKAMTNTENCLVSEMSKLELETLSLEITSLLSNGNG